MAETDVDNELLDYEEDEEPQGAPESGTPANKKEVKGSYVSIHSSGFRDFLLKPELLRAIVDCGFEHPSEGDEPFWTFLLSYWVMHIDLSIHFYNCFIHTCVQGVYRSLMM